MVGVDPIGILQYLISAQGLLQLLLIASAALLAWLLSRLFRQKLPGGLEPELAKMGSGSAYRMVAPMLLLALIWLGRFALAKLQPVPLLNIIIPLIAAFVVIRLAVYLLRHVMAPSALPKSFERFIVILIWGTFALYITGALAEMASALEDVVFPVGGTKVTLRLIIEAGLSAVPN